MSSIKIIMRLTKFAVAIAPMLFVLLWSTGFIGARFGLPYIEPMTFLAVRMVFVVVIMTAIAVLAQARWPQGTEIGHSLVAGALVHGLYLGGVFTAISQGVPAGISALIPGLQPILTSTIANRFMGERVTRLQWLGLVLGLIGVLMVLHDRSIVLAGSPLGWMASFGSLIGITLGTLYQKRFCGAMSCRIAHSLFSLHTSNDPPKSQVVAQAGVRTETPLPGLSRHSSCPMLGDPARIAGASRIILVPPPALFYRVVAPPCRR